MGSPQMVGTSGTMTPTVATSTPLEGAGLNLANLALSVNTAEHGRISPALKDAASSVLPPKTAELFARNDKGVLWFASAPLDIVPMPKPHHSVEYLAKRQKLLNGKSRAVVSNGSRASEMRPVSSSEANGIHGMTTEATAPEFDADDVLPVVVHGLEGKKQKNNVLQKKNIDRWPTPQDC